jgi:hypothetical protein
MKAPYNAMKKALLGGFWWQKQRPLSMEQFL